MSPQARFILFQLMIIVPFLGGMALKRHISSARDLTRMLIRLNLILIEPLIVLWSIWGLSLDWNMAVLPFSGLLLVAAGMATGRLMLPGLRLSERSRATFLISSSIANHGFTMGAFLCFLFLGERGLGLAFLFLSYFMIYIFTVIFPYARSVSRPDGSMPGVTAYLLDIQNMPLAAVVSALVLQLFHVQRPGVDFPVNTLMMISIAVYYFSLGMSFETSRVLSFLRENVALSLNRFLILPAITLGVLAMVNLGEHVEAVIAIQSFMPVAIYSVVASVLFDLDKELASNLFVFNTLFFLLIVLPLLFVFKGPILGI
ncbi:MAG TPA: AEC family transporter [Desulfomonilia bacterium]|jgi:predicted permease|nr:AEC family transporter [Deltaproteobacteria bacterium]HRS56078.1 AEC family transporter [Desulfomonilia bacterium]HRV35805.1 AEC family transporter [Desulfomonilia bacterium]